MYAELTFVCPSYWMAEAFSGDDRTSYKYQFSALPGLHGQDVAAYFGPLGTVPYLSTDYQRAFMSETTTSKVKLPTEVSQKYGATTSQLRIHLSRTRLRLAPQPTRRLQRTRRLTGLCSPIRRHIN
jgi:hypothetical protein